MRGIALLLTALLILAACLDARCDLDGWRGGAVLLCAGYDPVRIWPWPPVSPWFEDPSGQMVIGLTGKAVKN